MRGRQALCLGPSPPATRGNGLLVQNPVLLEVALHGAFELASPAHQLCDLEPVMSSSVPYFTPLLKNTPAHTHPSGCGSGDSNQGKCSEQGPAHRRPTNTGPLGSGPRSPKLVPRPLGLCWVSASTLACDCLQVLSARAILYYRHVAYP